MKNTLWTEKYRPQTINDYVFKNSSFKQKMVEWIRTGEIQHIGLFGPAGTGKTSALQVLLNGLAENDHIDPTEVEYFNMSDEGMDAVRERILPTAGMVCNGKYRVFVLEEMEQMSQKSQGSLKRVMEDFADNARFILTSNAMHRILPPIRSRIQTVMLDTHNQEEFMTHILNILIKENVDLTETKSIEMVDRIVRSTWPDFRKALNALQGTIVDGKIIQLEDSIDTSADYKTAIIDAAKSGSINAMRHLIVKNIPEDEIDEFFSFLFRNVSMFTPDAMLQNHLILIIRDGMVKSTMCADPELNLSAVLIEMDNVVKGV